MELRYKKEIEVTKEHIDELNHVNNVVYVKWIQDISREHWCDVLEPGLSRTYIWVVVNHFVEYKRPSLLGDTLIAETYIQNLEGSTSNRAVEFRNAKTNKIVVQAVTKWCLLDSDTKRPLRIPQEIMDLLPEDSK
ncbi:MAG: acyl-CoA thioesterase [Rhodothermaceae bacterium]